MWLRFCILCCLLTGTGLSQRVSFGVKAGVPVSPESQYDPSIPYDCARSTDGPICGNNYFAAKPYAVGPTVEAFLPWRLSVEADALYRRLHRDIAEGLGAPHGGPVSFGRRGGVAANAWMFPLLLKYSPVNRKVSPFAAAGATLRHLGPFDGQGVVLDFLLRPQPQPFHIESGRNLDIAITAGAGMRWRLAFVDISSEVRFMHWTSTRDQPVQNQAMLMLGVTLPARRR